MESWVSGWTAPKQEVTEAVREAWMWESGKDECVRTDAGPEAAYWRGTEPSRMGGYDFPGQITANDGSEGNGVIGAGFYSTGEFCGDRIHPSGTNRGGHVLDEGGNCGSTGSSEWGERDREPSSNGG
jgi:hypothetical protein